MRSRRARSSRRRGRAAQTKCQCSACKAATRGIRAWLARNNPASRNAEKAQRPRSLSSSDIGMALGKRGSLHQAPARTLNSHTLRPALTIMPRERAEPRALYVTRDIRAVEHHYLALPAPDPLMERAGRATA